METSKKEEAKFNARFPVDLFNSLRAVTKQHQRSINSELIWIVQEYIKKQGKESHTN